MFMDVFQRLHVMLDVLEPALGLFQWQVLHQSLVDIILRIAQQASSLQEDTPTCKVSVKRCLQNSTVPGFLMFTLCSLNCFLGHLSFQYRAGICSPSCQQLAYPPGIGTTGQPLTVSYSFNMFQ